MKLRVPTLFLAAALQVMPLLRNALPVQAQGLVPSAWAFILQLGVGAAAMGAYDTVSGATAPYFNCPTSVTGYVAVPFSFKATLTNLLNNTPGVYFLSATPSSIPAGLTLTTVDLSPYTSGYVYGLFAGKPTALATNVVVDVTGGFSGQTPVSTNVTFTILPAPVPQPANPTASVGGNITFTITAGPPPLTYQWHLNDTNAIAGATNASYTLANAQSTNAGSYSVVITNAAGSFTSSPTVLTLTAPPLLAAPPTNLTVTAGQLAKFTSAATGTAPLAYQWLKNGTSVIASATGTNYCITNTRAADAGSFTVVITNAYGSVTSSPAATLTVTAPAAPVGNVVRQGAQFLFTFNPVVGLTNTVLTNASAAITGWTAWTNIPPPATNTSITVTDAVAGPARFYRVQIIP